MLLFFAVDIDELRWHDFVLLSLVFVILEFLLLVACNAIQVKPNTHCILKAQCTVYLSVTCVQ
jgi:hypothetical protein